MVPMMLPTPAETEAGHAASPASGGKGSGTGSGLGKGGCKGGGAASRWSFLFCFSFSFQWGTCCFALVFVVPSQLDLQRDHAHVRENVEAQVLRDLDGPPDRRDDACGVAVLGHRAEVGQRHRALGVAGPRADAARRGAARSGAEQRR